MSRKKRTSRKSSHRKVRRNRYVLLTNARGALRRLTRNMSVGGIDAIEKIVVPAVGATGGMLFAQWLGAKVGPSYLAGYDPRYIAVGASALSALAAYKIGEKLGVSPDTQLSIAAGAGVAGLLPWVPPAMLPMVASVPLAPPAPTGTSGYYQRSMLGGLMVDVSHAGAPYKGMLGLGSDPADQSVIDDVLHQAEAISTVEPIDMALPAITKKAVRRVRERMGTPGDRGWAGGLYARNIFSAMSG